MKERRGNAGIAAAVLVLALLFSLFASCDGKQKGKEEIPVLFSIPEGSEEKLVTTGKAVYQGEEELHILYREGEGLYVAGGSAAARLDEDYQPGEWERDETEDRPRAIYGGFALYDGFLMDGEKKITLEAVQGEDFVGFWSFGGVVYLTAQQVDYDPVDIESQIDRRTVVYPITEKGLEDPLWTKGFTADGMSVGTDGKWNYFTRDNALCRTDGNRIQDMGNVTKFGVNLSTLRSIVPLDDSRVLLLSGKNLILLTVQGTDAEEDEEGRGTVVLGTVYAVGLLPDLVSAYNLTADDKIELREYESVEKLNLAFLNREIDIVAADDPGILEGYAVKGLLTPLEEVLGETVTPENIFGNVLNVCRIGGKIYMIPDSVAVEGMLLPESIVKKAGGRFQDMPELIRTLDGLEDQSFYLTATREIVLNNLLTHGLAAWLDREKGECRFTDESFVETLEFCSRFARDPDMVSANDKGRRPLFYPLWEMYRQDEAVLENFFEDVKGSGKSTLPYGSTAKVFPAPTGKNTGYAMCVAMTYGIPSESRVKKSAASFLNYVLSEETQYKNTMEQLGVYGMPVRIGAFERVTEELIHMPGSSVSEEELTERCREGRKMLESADHFGGGANWEIGKVVVEEAVRYFAGEITAKQAAEYVQNRVSIYLAEQG